MIKNFDELLEKVKEHPPKRVVIPAAHTMSAVYCATLAKEEGIGEFLLIGDKAQIIDYISMSEESLIDAFEIIDESDSEKCIKLAVEAVLENRADLILKGATTTGQLMKGVLNKEKGLHTGNILSDVLVIETQERLTLMTDGGIVLYPGVKEKISLINNAVAVAHKLENPCPNVALLCALEVENSKMPPTIDAAEITRMYKDGQITGCVVEGPLALDVAVSEHAAKIKKIDSPVAGNADILIMPYIEAGNIFGKAMTYYAHLRVAHVVMGAKVPILITSRADDAWTKLHSVALGIMCAQKES